MPCLECNGIHIRSEVRLRSLPSIVCPESQEDWRRLATLPWMVPDLHSNHQWMRRLKAKKQKHSIHLISKSCSIQTQTISPMSSKLVGLNPKTSKNSSREHVVLWGGNEIAACCFEGPQPCGLSASRLQHHLTAFRHAFRGKVSAASTNQLHDPGAGEAWPAAGASKFQRVNLRTVGSSQDGRK